MLRPAVCSAGGDAVACSLDDNWRRPCVDPALSMNWRTHARSVGVTAPLVAEKKVSSSTKFGRLHDVGRHVVFDAVDPSPRSSARPICRSSSRTRPLRVACCSRMFSTVTGSGSPPASGADMIRMEVDSNCSTTGLIRSLGAGVCDDFSQGTFGQVRHVDRARTDNG